MPITDFDTYGKLIYSLQERYPSLRRSTLVLATIGSTLAKLKGQLIFESDVVLDVWELVDFAAGKIRNYSYEIYQAGEKVACMTHLNIHRSPNWPVPILTINTSPLISSTNGSQRPVSASKNLTCLP